MSLNYEFAPIDVDIITHPKAMKAKCLAMGLWAWGQCYSKLHRTAGRLERDAVMSAWGDSPAVLRKASSLLVRSGLWLETDDGWAIFNFEKKGPGSKGASASTSAERMARKRARDACVTSQSDASQVTVTSTSPSLSTSSGSGSQIASPPEVLDGMPPWFDSACEAAAMAIGGEVGERPARWVEYRASRSRKVWDMNRGDALGWVVAVVRSERERERRASKGGAARGAEITKQPTDPDAPWMKLPEVG